MASSKRFHFAFSGKEILFIVSMLFFIAVLLFTLGLMLGQSNEIALGTATASIDDSDLDDEFDDDLGDDDLDDDLDDDTTVDKKASAKVAPKAAAALPKKAKGKLSFYKDLTQTGKTSKISSDFKRRYPMLSESVLMNNRGKYTVQVAAYAKESDAESKTHQLKRTCCSSSYYVLNEVEGKGVWYQVRIGFFEKLQNAKSFAAKLKKQNRIVEYIIKIVR